MHPKDNTLNNLIQNLLINILFQIFQSQVSKLYQRIDQVANEGATESQFFHPQKKTVLSKHCSISVTLSSN